MRDAFPRSTRSQILQRVMVLSRRALAGLGQGDDGVSAEALQRTKEKFMASALAVADKEGAVPANPLPTTACNDPRHPPSPPHCPLLAPAPRSREGAQDAQQGGRRRRRRARVGVR